MHTCETTPSSAQAKHQYHGVDGINGGKAWSSKGELLNEQRMNRV